MSATGGQQTATLEQPANNSMMSEQQQEDVFDTNHSSVNNGLMSDGSGKAATKALFAESQSPSDLLDELVPVFHSMGETAEDGEEMNDFKQLAVKCRESYLASLNTPERLAQHNAIMQEFIGDGSIPNPGPLVAKLPQFNPLFSELWEPWARKVQYISNKDLDLIAGGGEDAEHGWRWRSLATRLFSWAVPTLPLCKFMIDNAPNRKIAEIGSGQGYWSALLSHMGADVVACDDGSELGGRRPLYWHDTIVCDGVEFVQRGSADDRALFFCWARPGDMPARCIEAYNGDTMFFVGENGGDMATFDVEEWLHSEQGKEWKVAEIKKVPAWVGIHDYFLMCKRVGREQGEEEERASVLAACADHEQHHFHSRSVTPHTLRYLRLRQVSSIPFNLSSYSL